MNGNDKGWTDSAFESSMLFGWGSFFFRPKCFILPLLMRGNKKLGQKKNKTIRRLLFIWAGLFFSASAEATVNVYFSTSAATLESEFIASATAQYKATLVKSPFFANTFALTVLGKNTNYSPPIISSPIANATAVDRCMTYGFVMGMEEERYSNLQLINFYKVDASSTNTCGGYKTNQTGTANAFLEGCLTGYDVIKSTITQRGGIPPKILP